MLEIVSFYYPLIEPEAFHTGTYTEISQQCVCLFYLMGTPPIWFLKLSLLGCCGAFKENETNEKNT